MANNFLNEQEALKVLQEPEQEQVQTPQAPETSVEEALSVLNDPDTQQFLQETKQQEEKPWYEEAYESAMAFGQAQRDVISFGLADQLSDVIDPEGAQEREELLAEHPVATASGKLTGLFIGPGGGPARAAGRAVAARTAGGQIPKALTGGAAESVVAGAQLRGADSNEDIISDQIVNDAILGGALSGFFAAAVKGTEKVGKGLYKALEKTTKAKSKADDVVMDDQIIQRAADKGYFKDEETKRIYEAYIKNPELDPELVRGGMGKWLEAKELAKQNKSNLQQKLFNKIREASEKTSWSELASDAGVAALKSLKEKAIPSSGRLATEGLYAYMFPQIYFPIKGVQAVVEGVNTLNKMADVDALLALKLSNKAQQVNQFLSSKLGKTAARTGTFTSMIGNPILVKSEEEIQNEVAYIEAATKPLDTYQQVKETGYIKPQYIETWQTLYPNGWEMMKANLTNMYIDKYNKQGYLDRSEQIAIQLVTGSPYSYAQSYQAQQLMQSLSNQEQQTANKLQTGAVAPVQQIQNNLSQGDRIRYNKGGW